MDRAQLEQLALEKISKMQTAPTTSFDRAELERMALEKLAGSGQTEINPDQEASLGFGNRARYAIEPLQSNRKALLEQEYGQDNVMEDKKGELYIKQNGQFLPVNKEGVSAADFADFAGALPEGVGGVVGTVAGAVGGGGVLSVPGALGLGAAGGAVGSAARQAVSGLLGTPQVAGLDERLAEGGFSAAAGGAGAGLGLLAKAAKPGISAIIKNLGGKTADVTETAIKSVGTTTANTDLKLAGELIPEFDRPTAQAIMGEVADQSGRDVVQAEMKNLSEIAKRQGIPKPTYAQAAQGKALIAEAKVMDTPLIGRNVRKQVDGQLKVIRDNIENLTGRAITAQSNKLEVGVAGKEAAETVVAGTKKAASELYEQVEEMGAEATINTHQLYRKILNEGKRLQVVAPDGGRASYSGDLGMTETEFDQLQKTIFHGVDALKAAKGKAYKSGVNPLAARLPYKNANGIRRTIQKTAKEMAKSNPNAARELTVLKDSLDETMEQILSREHPKLGRIFSAANSTYRKYKGQQEVAERFFKDNGDPEKFGAVLTSGTGKVKEMKGLIGDDMVKKVALTDIADKLMILNDAGIGRAQSTIKALRGKAEVYREAIGEKHFNSIMENLHFLDRTGQPLNVSRASLYNLLDNRGPGLKSLALNIAGAGKTLAESKGITTGTAVKKIGQSAEKAGFKDLSSYSNILSDSPQRGASQVTPFGKVSERNQEIERRKRAISGSKP